MKKYLILLLTLFTVMPAATAYGEPVRISFYSEVNGGWDSVFTVQIPNQPELTLGIGEEGFVPRQRYTFTNSDNQPVRTLELTESDFPLRIHLNRVPLTSVMGVGENVECILHGPYISDNGGNLQRITGIRIVYTGTDYRIRKTGAIRHLSP